MRSSLVRRLPIPARLLVTLGVPLIALCFVLGTQVTEARDSGAALRAAISRSEVLKAAAVMQSCVVQPETTRNGLTPANIKRADLSAAISLSTLLLFSTQGCTTAASNLDAVLSREPGVMPAAVQAAFTAERQALTPVLAGDLSPAALARLSSARDAADDGLADMFLASAKRVPWFVYQGIIEVQRARYLESSAILVALAGISDLSPADISIYTGVRVNAINRTRFGTGAETRQEIAALIASPAYQLYSAGARTAVQIVAGTHKPVSGPVLNQVGGAALALSEGIESLTNRTQVSAANDLRLEAEAASRREHLALGIAGITLVVTLLAAVAALQSILRPLSELTRRAKELAAGRLDGQPVQQVGRDELTRLAQALESNAAILLHVNRQAQAMADGRLDDPSLDRAAPGPFGEVLHANVRAVQGQAARLRHDADHDPLTGLLNRAALVRSVGRTARASVVSGQAQRWLLFLDLDGFKQINDVHGHEQGDDVLRAVSERLLRAVRPGDVVARLGGDEFAVVLTIDTEAVSAGELERAVDRIAEAVRIPVPRRRSDAGSVSVGVSIGRAPIPATGLTFEQAMAVADADMYEVKRAGKARRAALSAQNPRAAQDQLVDLT